jgi:hypothetical protein
MPVELTLEPAGGKDLVVVRLSGKLTKEDYERLVPELDRLIRQKGKIRLLVQMHDFHGWEAAALWEDLKFDFKHFNDIERIAVVGEAKWEEWMVTFCKPFTTAEIRYFDHDKAAEAKVWLASVEHTKAATTGSQSGPSAA